MVVENRQGIPLGVLIHLMAPVTLYVFDLVHHIFSERYFVR